MSKELQQKLRGYPVSSEAFLSSFVGREGENCVYFGQVGNGKTLMATMDIIELLKQGRVVYANWQIDFSTYDERDDFRVVLAKWLFFRSEFYTIYKDNFHYISPDNIDVVLLARLDDVDLFIDEGQWIFNAHLKASGDDPIELAKRRLVLHGRHHCRSLNVITQRPINIMKEIRGQVTYWYKCVKVRTWPWLIFAKYTYWDMNSENLPVDKEDEPIKPKMYWPSKWVLNAYNTHAMREDDHIPANPRVDAYKLNFAQRTHVLLSFIPLYVRLRKMVYPGENGDA